MGNKIGKRRLAVDEKYTRPQGLYQHKDIDHKKLRKLIRDSKLAPCYPGDEECTMDLEECPICFLYYPSLNRSRCCMKGICTECFLQMKPPHSTRPTQCPFCKTSNYAVEYRGMKTKEEKGMEQMEEQRVIEAQIRMQQQELQDEGERMKKRKDVSSSSRIMTPAEVEDQDTCSTSLSGDESVSSQASCSAPESAMPSHLRQNRDGNFDLDLEDIMVMEAIWLSIQEQGAPGNPTCGSNVLAEPSIDECFNSLAVAPVEVSPCGLACAVAALAEHQHMNGDSAARMASSGASSFDMLQQSSSLPVGMARVVGKNPLGFWNEVSQDCGREPQREEGECSTDLWSEVTEAGTSYTGSDVMVDAGAAAVSIPGGVDMAANHLLPESFEEQMMLAMAVSLAEARARTNAQGLTWL